jgi:hypothetical protein
MILYGRNNGLSSNLSFTFDFGKNFSNFDCHSIALNENENYLLLVSNHELGFINFETFIPSITNTIGDENSIIIPCSSDIESVPLFDICNVNRPIVQWNYQDTNQYALAVDRLVRFYNVDQGRIQETNSIIDTQHQVGKKGSALAGSRTRVGCLEGNHANRYTTNASTEQVVFLLYYLTLRRT